MSINQQAEQVKRIQHPLGAIDGATGTDTSHSGPAGIWPCPPSVRLYSPLPVVPRGETFHGRPSSPPEIVASWCDPGTAGPTAGKCNCHIPTKRENINL